MNRSFLPLACGGLLLIAGCSKKAAVEEVATPKGGPTKPDPIVEVAIKDIELQVQKQQFDSAIGSLIALGEMPKTEQQGQAYMNQIRIMQAELSTRAAQGDPKAREALFMLGKVVLGR
jgi:hypothetical protein